MTANTHQRPRVLIVEDEPLVMMELEYTLTDLGYSVVKKARDLATGLLLAQVPDVDIALLDVNLSGDLSAPIADLLQEKGVPVVLVSGYTELGIPKHLRTKPRITKPFEKKTLSRTLTQLLGPKAPPHR